MAFGMFMAILDIQIVAASLAEIQAGLSASQDEIAWVQTAYLIAEVVMIPLSGYLSRLLSTRILFVISASSFTVMSLLCAASTSIEEMMIFRALQGFLGGAMIPTVIAGSYMMFGQGRAAGIGVVVGLVATLAPTIGPTLGGYLTHALSWHWLFLINVPIGIAITVIVWSLVDIDKPNWKLLQGFDFAGLALMAVFLGSIEYVLEEGARKNWFEDQTIETLTVVAVAAGVGFFLRVLSAKNPIVNLKVFRDRNFTLGTSYGFILGIGLYGLVYLMPAFLGRVRGYNSMQIGEILFITGLCQFIAAPIAGMLARRYDTRFVLLTGLFLMAISSYMLAFVTSEWSFQELLWPQILRGAGLMFCMVPANVIAMSGQEGDQLKDASGLYNLMRNLGGALGLAVLNTQLTDRLAFHYERLGESLSAGREVAEAALAGLAARFSDLMPGDAEMGALKTLSAFVRQQAATMAFADCFLVVALIYVAAIFTVPLLGKPRHLAREVDLELLEPA
ncbi:MAG: DHA2 family efflux MFS transporter permease subunit [Alphaproteobacteria bacterium]|nr:DHA2 family efflux MFS transporter permease subunit [Alphaproteobacteria bacterium]